MISIHSIKPGWNWKSIFFLNLTSKIFEVQQMTPNWTQESGMKSNPYKQFLRPWVPNFHPFHCTTSHFKDFAHFRIFPLTPMLKFQSATIFFKT